MILDRELMAAALPGYELGPELGRGASGVVVAARHLTLDRQVAIKLLPRAFAVDEDARNRFLAEARLIAQLDHPHIVKVFDYVAHEGLRLIIMEYLPGGSLWDRFTSTGLNSHQACAVTICMCAGLACAHRHGVVHRDMKPENVLLADDGTPRLSDFGIAKANAGDNNLTVAGTVLGTPTYMAPEQAVGGHLGPQCDIYALGTMLYELLAGRAPFQDADSPAAMLYAHAHTPPPDLAELASDIPSDVTQVVMRALEKDPNARHSSAEELGVHLARAAARAFGHGWLGHAGIPLRESGPIADAALEGPTRSISVPAKVSQVKEHATLEVGDDRSNGDQADDVHRLGVDFGTTYTAVAVHRRGTAYVLHLGNRSAIAPSAVSVDTDGTRRFGDAAARRLIIDPASVATDFKRRIGDPTTIAVGKSAMTPIDLTAALLGWVLDEAGDLEESQPGHITVSHPANWATFKTDLLSAALRRVTTVPTSLITEPQAAAVYYASQERVEPGAVVAIYDLGGGTFDSAVLRKTHADFEFLGQPEGIERLGGIDFDNALFHHVARMLDGAPLHLDPTDPTSRTALAFLHRECVDAKEALSTDAEARISVMLPNVHREVVVTRAEFEALIRPTLLESISALRRSMASAGVDASDVSAVLMVGGSSRIPLVRELIAESVAVPVAIDVHPKHCVALGSAIAGGSLTAPPREGNASGAHPGSGQPAAAAASHSAELEAFSVPSSTQAQTVAEQSRETIAPRGLPTPAQASQSDAPRATDVPAVELPPRPGQPPTVDPSSTPAALSPSSPPPGSVSSDSSQRSWLRRWWWIPVGALAVVVAALIALAVSGGDTPAPVLTVRLPAGVVDEDGRFNISYVTENFEPSIDPEDPEAFHLHFFWNIHDPTTVGTNVAEDVRSPYVEWDLSSTGERVFDAFTVNEVPIGASAICAVVATNTHAVHQPQLVSVTSSCIDL